jgi:VWFA-related protein
MRNFFPGIFLLFVLALSARVYAQSPTPTPDSDDVVKITTKLVQIDLIVVDKNGKQVRDLRAEDFDLMQDGKPQKITNFSYVDRKMESGPTRIDTKIEGKDKAVPQPPPTRVAVSEAGRVITFIVDDSAGSFFGVTAAREGVEKFIRDHMLPNDLVAIYQTRSGASRFQQYTNDKALLLDIAKKIRWYPSLINSDGAYFQSAKSNEYTKPTEGGSKVVKIESDEEKKIRENREASESSNQFVGVLGLVNYVVQGLRHVPGRKIVFFMSDGLSLKKGSEINLDVIKRMREVTDSANRSAVVINTIDARGVFDPTMIEARDEVLPKNDVLATTKISTDRWIMARDSQDGLIFMAAETGGTYMQNQNKLDVSVKRALDLETGYYLLAYEPEEGSFKDRKYNKISATVKRPDLKVISRAGYIGRVNEVSKPRRKTEDSELYQALVTPLPQPGLSIRLSAYFANTPYGNDFVRSMFHIDGNEITFADEPGGLKKVILDVVAVTMNEKNEVVDEFTRTHTLKFDAATAAQIKQRGLAYSADVTVKKAGTYTFRVAVRDGNSKTLGSASQVVTIPDLKRSGMYASGLTITGVDSAGKFATPTAPTAETAISLPPSTAVPAIRKFAPGSIVAYLYNIYSAKLDPATGKPRVSVKVNLYQNGNLIAEGKPEEIDLIGQKDYTRLENFSYMQLAKNADPGDYAIQIIVTDLAAGAKGAVSSQWVDFEIVGN